MGNVVTVDLTTLPEGSAADKLKEIIENEGLVSHNLRVEAGSSKGDNYSGPIYRVIVNGTDANNQTRTLSFILKCSVRSQKLRNLANINNKVFQREVRIYTDIIPAFEKMQAEANVEKGLEPLAKLYGYSLVDNDEYLIFQDLKELGFVMKDRQKTFDLQHCKMILEQLGYLHAFSLALKQTNPDLHQHYCDTMQDEIWREFLEGEIGSFLAEHLLLKVEKAMATLDPEQDKDVKERFEEFTKGIIPRLKLFADPKLADDYFVVMHGDCWTNNLLFKYEDKSDPDKPTGACLLDWQISRWCSPALELSYFIYNCTGTELRNNHFDEMIDFYYERATWMIQQLGANANEVYPRAALQDHMEKFFCFGVMMAINTMPLFVSDKDEIPDVTENSLDKENAKMWNFVSKNNDLFVERLGGIIRHAASRNYF